MDSSNSWNMAWRASDEYFIIQNNTDASYTFEENLN